ncbi:putative periplasmic lipoprotein [Vibrio spartinae]|uniref:Lipoprotein n=1 Tax=Vibrio spartinae TaxID=1918945 RepID=A0A1N6M621_9VIBR|nr:hypothetical protein [Vibrio spartinae]QMV14848.1 hypothetical protein Vspart_02123 [Vibrio spartinae]SIO94874.1 hypothetical protein VSP9026_02605 [Vibrio spartinae]
MKNFLSLILVTFVLTGCAATSSQNRYITVQDNVVSAASYNTRIVLSDGFVLTHQEDNSEFKKFSNSTVDQGNIITKTMVFDNDNIEVRVIDQTTVDVNSYWTPRSHLMGDKYKKSTFYHAGNKYYIQQFKNNGYNMEGYITAVGRYQLKVYVVYPESMDVNIDDVLTLTEM